MESQDFDSILDLINKFDTEEKCIEHLEFLRRHGHVVSPFATSSKVYKCSNYRYRCKETGKYFNVRTGTIFDHTKLPLQKWFIAIWIVTLQKKNVTSMQLAKDLNITQKSAWFMLQRIKECFDVVNDDAMETSETE